DHEHPLGRAWIEQKFTMRLSPELTITGRIDRVDVSAGKRALIIDYKYTASENIRDRAPIQAGLYVAAAERVLRLKPTGMLFCGLKKGVTWDGWESSNPEELKQLACEAEEAAVRVHQAVLAGEIAVRPTDPGKCEYCDFRDICRVETIRTGAAGA